MSKRFFFSFFLTSFIFLFTIIDFINANIFAKQFDFSDLKNIIIFILVFSIFAFIALNSLQNKIFLTFSFSFLFVFVNYSIFDNKFYLIILFILLMLYLLNKSKKIFTTFLLIIVVVNLLQLGTNILQLNSKKDKVNDVSAKSIQKNKIKSNIIILVFDSFPGPVSSKNLIYQTNFEKLNKRYEVNSISSNGIQTSYSLSNLLEMNYVIEKYEKVPMNFENNKIQKIFGGNNRLFNILKKKGYNITYINNNSHHNFKCEPIVDNCIEDFKSIKKIKLNKFDYQINEIDLVFFNRTLISKIININKFLIENYSFNIDQNYELIKKAIKEKPDRNLIFSYFLKPHDPINLDKNCNKIKRLKITRSNFENQLKCVNIKVINLANKIIKLDPDADIFILSDTGHSFLKNKEKSYFEIAKNIYQLRDNNDFLISILNPLFIYKTNDELCKKKLKETYSQVNIFRVYLNCKNLYSENKFPILDHKVLIAAYPHSKISLRGKILNCESKICKKYFFRKN